MKYVTSVAILAIFVVLGVTLAGMAEINIALAQTPSDNRAPEFILAQPYVEIHTEGYLFDTVIDAYILCYDYPDRISGVGDKLNVNLVHNATSIEYTGPLNGYPNDTFVIRYTCTDMAGHSIVFDQTVDSEFARSFPTYSDTRPPIFEGRGNIHVPPYKVDAFQNGTYKPPSCYDLHESYSHKFHPTGSFASTYDPADIDLSTLGTYEVELTCTDTAGNTSAAKQLVLVIAYVDDFPPENTFVFGFDFETVDIELDDNYPTGNMISFCADYPDPETGLHTSPGNFPATFSPAVDTSVPGTYQVDWYCEDDAENRSPVFASHTVHVLNSDGDRVDTTAPTLTLVSIESDNANDTTLAISGNTVTLSFTSSEDILEPVVTINGAVSTAVTGSGNTWSAKTTITSTDTDGAVTFTIDFSDLASNAGTRVTATIGGSSVTVSQIELPVNQEIEIQQNDLGVTNYNYDFDLDPLNTDATGITALNDQLWVADDIDDEVYVYNSDGSRDLASDFDLTIGNTVPTGITAFNDKLYVVDERETKVYVYNSDGSRDLASDFDLDSANEEPLGITVLNNKFWIVDASNVKVYAHNSNGIRDADSDFNLDLLNTVPLGITALDGKLWVADITGDKVYVYNTGGTRDADSDFDFHTDNTDSYGITALDGKLWVADLGNDKVYAYNTAEGIEFSIGGLEASTSYEYYAEKCDLKAGTTVPDFDICLESLVITLNSNSSGDLVIKVDGPLTDQQYVFVEVNKTGEGVIYYTDFIVQVQNNAVSHFESDVSFDESSDTTAPTLTAVSIASDNSESASLATTDDTVTLSFTSSENIETPTVTFGGVAASAVTGSGTSWSATKTITSGDSDGLVMFTIAYSDLATNAGNTVTSTIGGSSVIIDKTAPTLIAVNIRFSDLDNTSSATTDDVITLRFRSSEGIQRPSVTINDDAPTTLTGNGKTAWTATRTITSGDTGIVMFTIDYADLAANAGARVTDTDDNTSVTVVQPVTPEPPTTNPTLTTVSIESNNPNDPSRATTGDTITLSFTSSEDIETPTVTINGYTVTSAAGGDNTDWTATKTITPADPDGLVTFTIDYTNLAANDGIQITSTIGGSSVTVDNTAPTLTAVSIESNNTNDTTRATDGNIITLSITSSEPILPPTVTISGDGASATVTGSNTSWTATKTVASTDDDGAVAFIIDFTDLATNAGTQVISTMDGSAVTVDNIAPTLSPVSIVSDNADTSLATTDDTVTLSFISSEPIETPTVTFDGVDASATVTGSNTDWSATKTIVPADADGSTVTFAIDFTDLATNAGDQVTGPTDSIGVTVYQTAPDTTAPTLTTVSIVSDNSNDPSLATTGNTVTLSFISSEPIGTPTVTINTATATVVPTVTGSTTSWSATKAITAADNDGTVAFTIDFSDLADTPNTGTQVIATKDDTGVTVDKTAPTLFPVTLESSNADQFLAMKDDTITLRFTASEDIVTPVVTINGVDASATVTGSGDTWSATKIITAADVDGSTVTFTIDFTDLATNVGTTVTAVTEGVATITVDQTVPTLHTISITSNNSDDNTLATAGNTVTLSFESSEDIKTPVVTINQVPVTPVAVGDSTAWSATRIITSSDADDGIVAFTINYSDLASNAGVEVTGITVGSDVTVDNTAPTLTAVSIESSNADQFLATAGNVVTLRFTASEPILQPTVTINGGTVSLAALGNDNITWSATKTITSTDSDGPVTFRITFTDLAANDGDTVTSPTAGNPGVTVDNTAPTLTAVSIESNNSNDTTLAIDGNIITLSFTASENIETPTVTISGGGASVTVTGSNTSWSATKTVASTDDDGAVAFSISYSDLATNDGTQVTATDNNSSVTVDTTLPTLSLVSIVSDNADTTRATTDDTVTLSFTSSEPIETPTVTIDGVTASVVIGGDNTSWSATKTITPADADGSAVIFTIDFTDLATNDGIPITGPTDGTGVTVYQTAPDTTAPTLTTVSITSNNSNDPSRATIDDIITLSFTSSEPIGTPTVTINTATATVAPAAPGSTTSWSATKTIIAADSDGAVEFTIDFSDLAATPNTSTQVIATKDGTGVTVDNTAPTLNTVSIASDNANDTSRATTGDVVTLRFTSSEDILEPDVIINGVTVSTVTGSGDTWSATKEITATDNDGSTVTFAIDYADLASNEGTQVISTTSGSSVTVVQTELPTPPSTSQEIEIEQDDLGVTNTGGIKFSIGGLDASTYYEYSTSKCAVSDPDNCSDFTFAKRSDSNGVLVIIMAGPFTSEQYVFADVKEIGKTDPIYHTSFIVQVQGNAITNFESNASSNVIPTEPVIPVSPTPVPTIPVPPTPVPPTPVPPTPVPATPTLTQVTIVSDNSDRSLAIPGNTVTLSFTSSEPIETPTVTINGGAPATLTESNTSWSATKAITSTDPNGIVMFTINYSGLASNASAQVTGTTDNSSVTVDKTVQPPITPSASQEIDENNLGVTNTGGIKFSIGGLDASTYYQYTTSKCDVANPDDETCSDFTFAKRSDSNGVLVIIMAGPFTSEQYVFADVKEIGKADPIYHTSFTVQVQGNAITNFESNVMTTEPVIPVPPTPVPTTPVPPTPVPPTPVPPTPVPANPTLTQVSIASDNSNPSLATTGDVVTLSFTSSEPIETPTVTINGGVPATLTESSNTSWSATKAITSTDPNGIVMFTINYSGLASNASAQVTGTTDNSSVTVDKTVQPPITPSASQEIDEDNLGVTNTGGIKFSIGGLDASTYYQYTTSKCNVANPDDETCSDFTFAKRSDSNGVLVIIMAGPFTSEQYVFADVKEIGKADPIYHTDFMVQIQNDGTLFFEPNVITS